MGLYGDTESLNEVKNVRYGAIQILTDSNHKLIFFKIISLFK